MIEKVVVVGLAAGYLDWLLVGQSEFVPLWTPLVGWWLNATRNTVEGKPLICELCMAFWLSVVLHVLYSQVFGGQVELVGVVASAAIGLWYVVDMKKRNLIILSK